MSTSIELINQFKGELEVASSVLIGTHLNPDGDALGSALALSHYLDARGIQNEVLCHHSAPRNLRYLPGVDRIRQAPLKDSYDLGVMLDLDSPERLGNMEPFFARCKRTTVIDHHVPHEAPGDLRIVDTSAPATALILTRILLALEAEITPEIATCLLTGIVTDTGSFRFRNTTPEALSLSAILLECGGDINQVSEEIFQRKPLSGVRLLGFMLAKMSLVRDDQIAWSVLETEDFVAANAQDEDTEGFVNEMLAIETVQIAALVRQREVGKIRVSLRSRGTFDVASVARNFGGGGHHNAAGCTLEEPLSESVDQLVEKMKDCLASS